MFGIVMGLYIPYSTRWNSLSQYFLGPSKNFFDMEMSDLISADKKLSEFKSFVDISERAMNKVKGSPQVSIIESPLRLISFITGSHYLRPMWTFRAEHDILSD
jgi:hypothetical protein